MPPSFQDVFVKRVIKRTTRRESETEMWTEGQFMSEGDMKEERFSEQRILSIKQVCTENIGWVRRDRYERDVRLFWVEKRIAGKMLNLVQISKKVFIWQKDMQLSNACVYMYTHVYLIPTYTCIHTYIHTYMYMHAHCGQVRKRKRETYEEEESDCETEDEPADSMEVGGMTWNLGAGDPAGGVRGNYRAKSPISV